MAVAIPTHKVNPATLLSASPRAFKLIPLRMCMLQMPCGRGRRGMHHWQGRLRRPRHGGPLRGPHKDLCERSAPPRHGPQGRLRLRPLSRHHGCRRPRPREALLPGTGNQVIDTKPTVVLVVPDACCSVLISKGGEVIKYDYLLTLPSCSHAQYSCACNEPYDICSPLHTWPKGARNASDPLALYLPTHMSGLRQCNCMFGEPFSGAVAEM